MENCESFDHKVTFESFGVVVTLESDDPELLDFAFNIAKKGLLENFSIIENEDSPNSERFGLKFENGRYELYRNGICTNSSESKAILFKYYSSILRLTVAENAVDRIFVHAGVVAVNGKAAVFPAHSHRGKTTLVSELIKAGAEYYSDEYAVIDFEGLVHPFPRCLTIRDGIYGSYEKDVAPERFSARIGKLPLSIGSVILTEFAKGERWEPEQLTLGEGILETIPHIIPLHSNTELSLNVLSRSFQNAIFLKGPRGEAPDAATEIIEFLNKNCN